MIEIGTAADVVPMHYQKPIHKSFRNDRCWEIGAIWTVQPEQGTTGVEEMVGARCDGNVDLAVHSAWMTVRDYIATVAKNAGHEPGYQPDRRSPIKVTMDGIETDFYAYLQFSPFGVCLDVKQPIDKTILVTQGGIDCGFVPSLNFTAKRTGPTSWSVTSVQAERGK